MRVWGRGLNGHRAGSARGRAWNGGQALGREWSLIGGGGA